MTEHSQSSELNGEDAYRGRELLVSSDILVADVLTRSGLPLQFPSDDTHGTTAWYRAFTFKDSQPRNHRTLTIEPREAHTFIKFEETELFKQGGQGVPDRCVDLTVNANGQITRKSTVGYGDDQDQDITGYAIDELLKAMPLLGNMDVEVLTLIPKVQPEQGN